jgi:hypothetical protein
MRQAASERSEWIDAFNTSAYSNAWSKGAMNYRSLYIRQIKSVSGSTNSYALAWRCPHRNPIFQYFYNYFGLYTNDVISYPFLNSDIVSTGLTFCNASVVFKTSDAVMVSMVHDPSRNNGAYISFGPSDQADDPRTRNNYISYSYRSSEDYSAVLILGIFLFLCCCAICIGAHKSKQDSTITATSAQDGVQLNMLNQPFEQTEQPKVEIHQSTFDFKGNQPQQYQPTVYQPFGGQ